MENGLVNVHERIGQGQSQGDGFRGTVEHAGFAVPAFLGEFHHRTLVHLAIKHKDVGIADIRACAIANAFFNNFNVLTKQTQGSFADFAKFME